MAHRIKPAHEITPKDVALYRKRLRASRKAIHESHKRQRAIEGLRISHMLLAADLERAIIAYEAANQQSKPRKPTKPKRIVKKSK